jgi:outer membrane protein assembly factor BamB
MRRPLIVLAAVAVLLTGILAAIVIHRLQRVRNVHGSSTQEFTLPTTTVARPTPQPLGIQWPQYGYDAQRTRALDLPLRPPFRPVWRWGGGSLVEFPPVIGYGRLYVSTNSGEFAAISMTTGKRAWKYFSRRCVASSPALGPQRTGTVFAVFLNPPPCNATGGGTGKVIAFSAGHGEIRWQKTIGPSETSPLLVGDRLYVGDWNGDVWALDARSGKTLWRYHTGGAVKGGAALSGNRLYVGSYDGHVYCIDARNGTLVWKQSGQGGLFGSSTFYATPAVAYGRVYIGSTDGKMYSFGAASGSLIWSYGTGGYVYASPAVSDGLVFVGSYSKTFYAFDAATGDVRWSFAANGQISGSPTVIGNVVYFATLAQRTYALNIHTGKVLWTFPDGKYTPVVAAKGKLFLTGYGKVYGMVPR